jgi:hypothetical protein
MSAAGELQHESKNKASPPYAHLRSGRHSELSSEARRPAANDRLHKPLG